MSDRAIILIFWVGLSIIIMSPLIYWPIQDWHAKRYVKRFRRLHPDWVEAYNALIESANEGKRLDDKRVTFKAEIDVLMRERAYMPYTVSREITEHIESLKQKHWDTTDRIAKHNKEHEKKREHYEELSKKYNYKG